MKHLIKCLKKQQNHFLIENGYGDWLKNEKLNEDKLNNMGEMGAYFEKKKKESRELIKRRGIQEINMVLIIHN